MTIFDPRNEKMGEFIMPGDEIVKAFCQRRWANHLHHRRRGKNRHRRPSCRDPNRKHCERDVEKLAPPVRKYFSFFWRLSTKLEGLDNNANRRRFGYIAVLAPESG